MKMMMTKVYDNADDKADDDKLRWKLFDGLLK